MTSPDYPVIGYMDLQEVVDREINLAVAKARGDLKELGIPIDVEYLTGQFEFKNKRFEWTRQAIYVNRNGKFILKCFEVSVE